MVDYEYICPSCGKPMDGYEPYINVVDENPRLTFIAGGLVDCRKCNIRALVPDDMTRDCSSEDEEEELAKAQAAFDNMLKSFGIKKRPKSKPCPVCGGVDFDIDYSEPYEVVNGEWSASPSHIKCEDCGFRLGAVGADSMHKNEAKKLADLANKAIINAWNSIGGASDD